MPSSSHAACTRFLIRARPRIAITTRQQSTFSFFSRNQDATTPAHLPTKDTTPSISVAAKSSHSGPLRTTPSFAHTAPLLSAIRNKDQEAMWTIYSSLSRSGQLSSLLPLHHSLILKSIRPEKLYRFLPVEIVRLTERFEQVWSGMSQCQIQPDMNDYTARLEFYNVTRQYQMVNLTWAEIRDKAATSASNRGNKGTQGPLIQPTLYTYNLVLSSCVPRKDIALAMETIGLMRRAGIKPDAMSWDYVLQIHTANKDWRAVESTYRSTFVTTPFPSTTGTGANTYPQKSGNSEWMTIPLGQRAKSLHGGAYTPNHHQTNNRSSNNKEKLVPTLQNIHTLFSYYAYTRDLEDLRQMFDSHVRLFGLVPTTRSYNEMIKFAFLARRDGDALELFKELALIGQNLDMYQQQRTTTDEQNQGVVGEGSESSGQSSETAESQPSLKQVCGPDFYTFRTLINNDLILSRNRWGRAWKWLQIMQDDYGLEPSDRLFSRTLAAMRRRNPDEASINALIENWDRVRAKRDGTGSKAVVDSSQAEDEGLAQVTSSS
ncbi:hypothetical protein B0O80DRAFT_444945 [Mortierella sp. GBAus27b]|nr:hypothetical protein BGX31_001897 [Mortierella sp. GBA43]KAI8357446.1 hypothetical protein B0O80DRAFT_444945 [Mortierella sp. GBAus27b]